MSLLIASSLLILSQVLIWYSTNAQLIDGWSKQKAFMLSMILAIPTSTLTFYATRYGFKAMGSLWSLRLLAFGLSYVVFPVLTWVLLKESPFNTKTMICIGLSFVIVAIQIFLPDT